MRYGVFAGGVALFLRVISRFSVVNGTRGVIHLTVQTADTTQLGVLLTRWESERIRLGCRSRNAAKQATRLRTLFRAEGWEQPGDITREAVVGVLRRMGEAGKSTSTTATLHSLIAVFCAFLALEGVINFNPCSTIPHARRAKGASRRKGVRPFTNLEVGRLVRAALADELSAKPRFSVRRSFVYRLLALTGARYGQVVRSLRWSDVDLDRGTITFDHDHAKSGYGVKLPLHSEAVGCLQEWAAESGPHLPTDHVFPRIVQDRVIRADMRAAGIPDRDASGRAACFHSFRKYFATQLVARGVSVKIAQQLLQHRDVKMTLDIYAEVQEHGLAEGLSQINPFAQVSDEQRVKKNLT